MADDEWTDEEEGYRESPPDYVPLEQRGAGGMVYSQDDLKDVKVPRFKFTDEKGCMPLPVILPEPALSCHLRLFAPAIWHGGAFFKLVP